MRPSAEPTATRTSFLHPLSQTCAQLHNEFLSWFQAHTTLSIKLVHLNTYLSTFHPLDGTSAHQLHPVKLCLLLPQSDGYPRRTVPYTALTRLHTLMSQHANFTVRVAPCSKDALGAALARLASAALPVPDGILAVRLVMLPTTPLSGLTVQKPVLWLVVKQHSVLPGEWPWYGAVDLHGESKARWLAWWKSEDGPGDVEGWDVRVMVKRSREDVPRYFQLTKGEEEYLVVPERGVLEEEGVWEGREWERETLRLSLEEGGGWDWGEWERARRARRERLRRAQEEREMEDALMETEAAELEALGLS